MITTNQALRYTALIVMVLVAPRANAQTPKTEVTNVGALVARISVLPRYNQWALIEPELRPALKEVVRLTPTQRDRLVRSGTPAERGIGIFVADQQGDIAALLSYADLLDDGEPTLPFAQPIAHDGPHVPGEQTVGEYLTSAYLAWFGVNVDGSPRRFKRLFGDVRDPERLVRPWIVRLRRADGDAKQVAQLKERISSLPEDVRWAVITLGYKNSVYSSEEARKQLAALSPSTRQAIAAGADLLPDEPLFRANDGAFRRVVLENCRELLSPSQP